MKDNGIDLIEKSLIAIAINDNKKIADILTNLDVNNFSVSENRFLFGAIKELSENNSPIDALILLNKIATYDEQYISDAPKLIGEIDSLFINSIDLYKYINLIKNNSTTNEIKKYSQQIIDKKFDLNKFNNEIWDIEKEFLNILQSQKVDNLVSISTIADDYKNKLEILKENANKLVGSSTGFKNIDDFTNGFQSGDLIILAARPSIGKTALALNMLCNVAKQCNEDEVVVMFSLEMASEQLLQRIISCESGINSKNINFATWSDTDEYVIQDTINKISQLPILIDDNSNTSIMDIYNKLKQIKSSNKKIKLIVVDYLQLVQGSNKIGMNRQQEVSQISRTLKIIARDIDAPVIAVAQLSRKIEERKGADKKPILSDLRESGSIEQDADLVTFLNYDRDEIDNGGNNNQTSSKKYIQNVVVEYIIAKHRNGTTGETKLLFEKQTGKYSDI